MHDNGGTVWQLLGMLAVVLLVLVFAWLATRWLARRGLGGYGFGTIKPTADVKFGVLAQLPIGRAERLLLVRVADRCLLLGVTEHTVTLLAELDEDEAADFLVEEPPRPSFLEAVQENLRKKK